MNHSCLQSVILVTNIPMLQQSEISTFGLQSLAQKEHISTNSNTSHKQI